VIITQLAFSPTQNLLVWTDDGGSFSRWTKPIPDTLPSPVKIASTGTSTIAVKRKADETFLFGDNAEPAAGTGDTFEDIAMNDMDDWIIDDTGGLMMDDDTEGKRKRGLVKEMGGSHLDCLSLNFTFGVNSLNSEYHESATGLSAWVNAYGKQETVPWSVHCR
jgi:hypothetical protein